VSKTPALPQQLDVHEIKLRLRGALDRRFLEIKQGLGLEQDSEALRAIISAYFVDKVLVSPEFVEWFCKRNHKPVMTLAEVIQEYELFKQERRDDTVAPK